MAHSRIARAVSQLGTLFGFVVFGGIAASGSTLAGDAASDPQRVFRAPRALSLPYESDSTALRSRAVEVDRAGILGQDALVLDLFDDVACVAFRDENRPSWLGDGAWVGRDPSDPASQVNFVVQGDVVVGTIRLRGALYKLRPIGEQRGLSAIELVDENRFPSCAVGREHQVHATGGLLPDSGSSAGGALALQSAAPIDVMVLYTPQARAGAGSQASIEATINLAVLEANQTYVNSLAGLTLNLVHKAEIAYTETNNFSTDLTRLQNPADGFMDTVHALRDTYKADMVSLIVNASSSCGIGYVMTNISSSFQGYAFSLVSRTCATGYYSFAHELGHNLGCAHDRQTGGTGAFTYSYGYRNPSSTWRTVMAYAPGARIPYFSNPLVSYQSEPTGVASTSSVGCDNAKSMTLTAPVVSAFRTAGPSSSTLVYGQGKLTSRGERPEFTPLGTPNAAGSGFNLKLARAIPKAVGIVHMASQQASSPFYGGTLYAALPVVYWAEYRTLADGTIVVPVPNLSGLVGQTCYYQAFFRDVLQADHTGVGMSNGVKVTYSP